MITALEVVQLLNAPAAKASKPLSDASRSEYWREYHSQRQATDPEYRARKIKAALRHKANHG